MSIESSHDDKRWVDASTATPDLVAWQYPEAVEWVHQQFLAHRDSAAGEYRERIDEQLDAYLPALVGPDVQHWRDYTGSGDYCPHLWERLPAALQGGGWAMEPYQLSPGRKLVMQILGFADRGQPAGLGPTGRPPYEVCDRHERPSNKPYLGLTNRQREHYVKYDTLYVG
jgi:hypothetical protein